MAERSIKTEIIAEKTLQYLFEFNNRLSPLYEVEKNEEQKIVVSGMHIVLGVELLRLYIQLQMGNPEILKYNWILIRYVFCIKILIYRSK